MWLTQCTGPITRIEDGSITKKQKFGTLKSSNVALSQCVFCIRRYLRQTWIMLLLLLCLLRWKCWWSVIIIPFNWSTLACIKIVIHTHTWKTETEKSRLMITMSIWFISFGSCVWFFFFVEMYTSHSNRFGIYSTVIWLTVMFYYIYRMCVEIIWLFSDFCCWCCVCFLLPSACLVHGRHACMILVHQRM